MTFRQTLRPADRPAADGTFWYGPDRSILHRSGRVLAGPPAAAVFAELPPEELRNLLVDSLRWWMAPAGQDDDRPTAGADDAVLGACRALVRHSYGRWLSNGGPPPSGRQARAFQDGVLRELLAASSQPA